MYQYWGYGLKIESEIEFPELFPYPFTQPDVSIKIGQTPAELDGIDVARRVRLNITKSQYLIEVLKVATYFAQNGNEIIVEPQPDADDASIRLFLLGNPMPAILYQRGSIPFHASAIKHNGGLALICGASGAGKSTSLSLLMQQGHQVFSDDVCVLHSLGTNPQQINAFASYPAIKLWEETFGLLKIDLELADVQIRPDLPKYGRYFHGKFQTGALGVKHIFVLEIDKLQNEVTLQQLSNIQAFSAAETHIYRPIQMNAMKLRKPTLIMLSNLLTNVKVHRITRPSQGDSTKDVLKAIEQALQAHE